MRRRKFLPLLGALTGLPFATAAQAAAMPAIGFLHSSSPEQYAKRRAAFHKGLSAEGFVEGRNVGLNVTLIATSGSTPAPIVAKATTATIPIVFAVGSDLVANGLVASISQPGGNVTGITSLNAELVSKRLGLFRELVPTASRYFMFINPTTNLTAPFSDDLQRAAVSLGIRIEVHRANTDAEIDAAFASIPEQSGSVIMFSADLFFYTRRAHIAELALRHKLPTSFDVRDYVDTGGLMSYGSDFLNVMELAGTYAGRILRQGAERSGSDRRDGT